jgi:hypothetical protein
LKSVREGCKKVGSARQNSLTRELLRPFAKVESFVNFRLPSSLRSADSKAAALRVKTYHRVGDDAVPFGCNKYSN